MTQQVNVPQKPKRKATKYVVTAVIIVIVIIAIVAIIGSQHGNIGNSGNTGTPTVSVNINNINLQISYTGITSGYLGPTSQALSYSNSVNGGQQFTLTIEFTSSALLLSHDINSITLNTNGFTLISISPNLPYSLSPSSSVSFSLIIQAPNYNFDGPLNILVSTS